MVRYNNKYEKQERKKLQNRNKKTEIETGKVAFNSDPWLEKEYKNLTAKNEALLLKVTADHSWKTFYLFDIDKKIEFTATFTKNLPKELSKFLVVWDYVYYDKKDDNHLIVGRKKRLNKLARIKWDANRLSLGEKKEQIFAVNIDYGIIVSSTTTPKFNPGMIERYLILFEYHDIKPILCLTKTDLHSLEKEEYQIFLDLGLEIFFITDKEDKELSRLKDYLTEKTVVFVWNSWVWKTSLTNKIYGDMVWKEWETSQRTWYGQHTTTSSTVYEWREKSFVIDTPGIMNLNLFETSKDNLKYLFSDFQELNNECKYKKCTHTMEPDCAVQKAFHEWRLPQARYELYLNLLERL